jgi:hypothetical protein
MILANPAEPADAFAVGRLPCSDREVFGRKFPFGSFYCHVLSLLSLPSSMTLLAFLPVHPPIHKSLP